MRNWTHDELHALMDKDPALKAKSDRVHAFPQITSDEKEQGKLHMMEIYAEAVNCRQVDAAKEFIRKVFLCLRQERGWETLRHGCASQKLCHSPNGNDYLCFCWVRFYGKIAVEDETGITLETTDGSEAILRVKTGDYRKDNADNVEIRIGSYANFLKYPKGCEIKRRPKE